MKQFLESLRTGNFIRSQQLSNPTCQCTFAKLLVLTQTVSYCFKFWQYEVQQLLKTSVGNKSEHIPSEIVQSMLQDNMVSSFKGRMS